MAFGVIVNVGITAMITAQINGTAFKPNLVKVSSTLLACTGEETTLPDIVWTAPASAIAQIGLSSSIMRTIINMDVTVGDFIVATVGIFDSISGTLFALGAFPGAGTKIALNPPATPGNIRTLYLDSSYADVNSMFQPDIQNLSIITLSEMIANLSGGVTARQLRSALNSMNLLSIVNGAIANAFPNNQAVIDWDTCATTMSGNTLISFIANATGQADGGAAILALATTFPA